MKKKHFMLYLTIVFILLSLTFNVPAEKNNDEIKIVCTNSVLADFTKNICPENFTVDYIMPAGVCPAHFDISPSDVSKIINADIIISLGWEPWLSKLLKNAAITNYSEIKCSNLGEWNIPSGAKKYVSKISEELSKILTRYNQTIKMKTKSYLNQINKTAEQLKDMFTRFGYEECKVVCMQWQKDFAEWLGLNVTASFGPPETLSTRDKINVTMTAKEENAILIIDNLQSGTDFGEIQYIHPDLNNYGYPQKKVFHLYKKKDYPDKK